MENITIFRDSGILYVKENAMSKKDKLIERLLKKPKDFTFDEMVSSGNYS